MDSGEGYEAGSASLKGPLPATNRLAGLEFPHLTFWNRTREHVFVPANIPRVHRTPTINPLVEKSYDTCCASPMAAMPNDPALSGRGGRACEVGAH